MDIVFKAWMYIVTLLITLVVRVLSTCALYEAPVACAPVVSNQSERRNMINNLLKDYDNLMRPDFDSNNATYVTVDLYINSVDSIRVDTMDLSVNIYLRQKWTDPRLKYSNDSMYTNVSHLTIDSKLFDKIWVPDLFFPNEKRAHAHCITMPNRLLRIFPDGEVLYSSRYTLTLACNMSLKAYPFDRQVCYIRMESYGYTLDEMQFMWLNEENLRLQIDPGLELPQFTLKRWEAGWCQKSYITGDFTCLEAKLFLEREYGYFIIQNYVPSMLIVILSWVSFWINIDAVPARISLGVMTVLTITTQSVGIWMALPRVSYVKALDVWMSTNVMFVFLAMLEFAIVNTLARKEIRMLSLKAREIDKDDSSDIIKRMMDEHTYGTVSQESETHRMLARKVDKRSRILFPCLYASFNVFYWCIYLIQR